MSNLTEHKCAGKCPEFKGDQCHHCLIQQIEKREFELGVALEDAYVKCGTSQVIDCTGISSKKVELRFKAGEVVVTASPEFKGGDWVVLANSVSRESTLAQILKTDSRWSIIKWLDDNTESNVRLDFLRHATDEEIAVGRRLDHFRDVADMVDDAHIENHISPLCLSDSRKNESQSPLSIKQDALSRMESCYIEQKKHVELLQTEVTRLNSTVERLKAENKILNQAASTHLRNQNQFMDLYNRLVEQLYPYAIDLEEPVDGDVNTPKEYMDGYNRARECVHYNLLEMMKSDEEYICAQCDMLGGGGEA